MKKSFLMPSIVLSCICIAVALLLAGVNSITGPIISANQGAAANKALIEVLPDGKNFRPIELTDQYPAIVTAAYAADGGYVFQMSVTGKSAGLVVMCGIDAAGHIVATKVIANEETPSYADKVFPAVEGTDGAYASMSLDGFEPYLVSGATLTSKAYGEAIQAALQSAAIAGGAVVDTRTPEQILQDDCNAALGTTDKTFDRWFATELLVGIDKAYEATDRSGFVFVIDGVMVGVNADGVVTDGVSEQHAALAATAYATAAGSTLTELPLPDGVDKTLVSKAYVTDSGNYVFELNGPGYAAYYGTMINIRLCLSSDGAILDCLTTKHKETKGYGDKCATEEYRDGWIGATGDDVVITVSTPNEEEVQIGADCTDIGAISSATFTTFGYQSAVKAAFAAFDILTEQGGQSNDQ